MRLTGALRLPARTVAPCLALLLVGIASCRGGEPAAWASRSARLTVSELQPPADALALPLKSGSLRFAVIGDSGRGDRRQYDTAQQMTAWRDRFPFEFVLMLGDNIYDRHTPQDYADKFEKPYAALLEKGVRFYAAIGNHDDDAQVFYGKFNMGGRRYYSFRKGEGLLAGLTGAGARFFALDSRSLDPEQLDWLRQQLAESGSAWKICFFHHPLYTSGRYGSGARALRLTLEPILVNGDVDVVLSGHEHFYERTHPQNGILYFVSGAAGALRPGDIRPSALTARGYDEDCHFLLVEIAGNELFFQAVSRTGRTVDAGVVTRARAGS